MYSTADMHPAERALLAQFPILHSFADTGIYEDVAWGIARAAALCSAVATPPERETLEEELARVPPGKRYESATAAEKAALALYKLREASRLADDARLFSSLEHQMGFEQFVAIRSEARHEHRREQGPWIEGAKWEWGGGQPWD